MTGPKRNLHLNYFHHPSGCHEAGGAHPDAEARDVLGFEHLVRVAQTAEDACLDSIFLAYGTRRRGSATRICRSCRTTVALAAVASLTKRIGSCARCRRPSTSPSSSLPGSRRLITSATAARAGISSRPRPTPRRVHSALMRFHCTTTATDVRPSSSRFARSCGTAGSRTRSSTTRWPESGRTRARCIPFTMWASTTSLKGCASCPIRPRAIRCSPKRLVRGGP